MCIHMTISGGYQNQKQTFRFETVNHVIMTVPMASHSDLYGGLVCRFFCFTDALGRFTFVFSGRPWSEGYV